MQEIDPTHSDAVSPTHPITAEPMQKLNRRLFVGLPLAMAAIESRAASSAFNGTFIQPWRGVENTSKAEWRRHIGIAKQVGCNELILQWTGLINDSSSWVLPDETIGFLFDLAQSQGMVVRVGFKYDERWWSTLSSASSYVLNDFFSRTEDAINNTIYNNNLASLSNFNGWYLPYEIDQYNWANINKRQLLVAWLQRISSNVLHSTGKRLSVSTFFSPLPTRGELSVLWNDILAAAPIHPMIQDGIGVSGLGNYSGLITLRNLLVQRGIPFDLIVELFQQTSASSTNFTAVTAPAARVATQIEVAKACGAEKVIAYTVNPWLMNGTTEASKLLEEILKH